MIRGNERFVTQLYVFVDLLFILIGFLAAWWVKFVSPLATNAHHLSFNTYFLWGIVYAVIAIYLGYFFRLYMQKRKKTYVSELFKLLQIHIMSLVFLLSGLFVMGITHFSRTFLLYFLISNLIGIALYRLGVKHVLHNLRERGFNKQYILVLGAGSVGRHYYDNIVRRPGLGLEVIGFLDDYQTQHQQPYQDYSPILGKVDDLEKMLEEHPLSEVVIALPLKAHDKYQQIVSICEKAGVRVAIIPDYYQILPAKPHIDVFGDMPVLNIRDIPLDDMSNRISKRLFDIVFSMIAVTVTLPLMLLIAIAIKLDSPGPVIFKQERIGFNNKKFTMYKFRSMQMHPEDLADTGWTTVNDNRRTKIGAFLRKTSLDELPQFFNVLKGEMSVVGPRPERPHYVNQFREDVPKYMIKHHVRPGITGWAQVNGLRGDTSISNRIQFDLFYVENWTFFLDLKIILKTMINGFINKNAY